MDITDRLLDASDMDGREVREEAAAEIRRLREQVRVAREALGMVDAELSDLRLIQVAVPRIRREIGTALAQLDAPGTDTVE